jgi:DNA-binding NarL/FixJ family response regulator
VAVLVGVRLFRDALVERLGAAADLEVVGALTSARDMLLAPAARRPDVVVADLTAGDPAAFAELATACPDARVVLLGVPGGHRALDFVRVGVRGFVDEDALLDDVLDAVRAVAEGGVTCPPEVVAALMRHAADGDAAAPHDALSRRELEILELIEQGLMNKQIANRLQIEPGTVKNHVHNIFRKLGVHRRSDAVAVARGGAHAAPAWARHRA